MSIRRRMTLTIVGALLLLLGTAGALLYGYLRSELTDQFDAGLAIKAQVLAGLLRQGESGKVEFDFSDNAMPEFSRSKAPEYFQLWAADGSGVERSDSLGKHDLTLQPGSGGQIPRCVNLILPDGRPGRGIMVRASPITDDSSEGRRPEGTTKGAATAQFLLAVALDRSSLDRTLTTIALSGAGGITLLALGFGLLVPWLVGRNLRPLEVIAAQASRIDAASLGARFPVEAMPTELRPICTRLNDSLERLQAAFARERRFSGDVAHELRTPIAELRLLAEVGVKFGQGDPQRERSFRDALAIALQMEAIVETLLEMIGQETPLAAEDREAVDIDRVAEEAWRPLEALAAEKRITLRTRGRADGSVPSSAMILRRLFGNLLGNAVEYSPAGAIVTWAAETTPDRVTVTLSNPTTDLEQADIAHLAEPFWRKDAARTGGRHVGLGLALVACYARRLRIRIEWSIPQPGQFQVVLQMPR